MTTPAPGKRQLATATAAALVIAAIVLVAFVLPAEYGIDPTGVGAITGVARLSEDAGEGGEETPIDTTPPATFAVYASSFPLTYTILEKPEGYLSEGESALLPIQIANANLTQVTLKLEFSDANVTPSGQRTRPDLFEIELKAPHGDVSGRVLVRSDPTSGGGIGEVSYLVRAPPPPRELEARDPAEARDAFARNDPPDATLAGEWLARVTLVEAGDAEAAQGLPLGAGPAADTGESWRATLSVQTYALEVAEKPGTRQRSDVVTLPLAAGGEMEYKLRMALGQRMDYTWSTDGPVLYYDFHGEKQGDASGAFARHRNGDAASDTGTLVAPFDGSHGWYWRNDGNVPVVITLETRGAYDVIGRV